MLYSILPSDTDLVSQQRQGQSLARPLARRLLSTSRPPRVAMRARNPCVRLRRTLLGWNVLFINYWLAVEKRLQKQSDAWRAGSRKLYA